MKRRCTLATGIGLLAATALTFPPDAHGQIARLERPTRVLGLDEPLHRIRDVAVAGDRIFVLTARAPAVHIFQLGDSRAYTAFGREGGGPGELTNPQAIVVRADTVHVLDLVAGSSKVVTYSLSGEVKRTTMLDGISIAARFASAGGQLIVEAAEFGRQRRTLFRVAQPPTAILVYEDVDRVQIVSEQGPMQRLRTHPPFAPRPRWAATPDGRIVFWPGSGTRLNLLATTGTRTGSLELPDEPIPVSTADRQVWLRESFPAGETLFGVQDPYRGLRAAAERSVTFPNHFPAALRVESDPAGGIWVLRAKRANGELWSMLRDGQPTQHIVLPPFREVVAFGRSIVVAKTVTDEGVELVEIYTRPGAR